MSNDRRHRLDPGAGFALIDMLVSLAILAVLTSVSLLALRSPGQDAAEAEARRLAARVDAVSDRALLENTPMVLAWTSTGYSFAGAHEGQSLSSQHSFRGGVSLIKPSSEGRFVIDPNAGGKAIDLILHSNAIRWRVSYDGLNTRVDPVSGS